MMKAMRTNTIAVLFPLVLSIGGYASDHPPLVVGDADSVILPLGSGSRCRTTLSTYQPPLFVCPRRWIYRS